jgi:hypothetical protein
MLMTVISVSYNATAIRGCCGFARGVLIFEMVTCAARSGLFGFVAKDEVHLKLRISRMMPVVGSLGVDRYDEQTYADRSTLLHRR